MNVRTWGSTLPERESHFPCDDVAFAHDLVLFRAVSIEAPPTVVYRWLAQLRVAPYSYDLLDNFARRSPSRLTPGVDALALGQPIMTIFRVAGFEYGRSLTIALASSLGAAVMGTMRGSYRVDATPTGARLIAKVLVRYPAGPYGRFLRRVMPSLDFVMFRKQLLTLQRFAQRDARALRYRAA